MMRLCLNKFKVINISKYLFSLFCLIGCTIQLYHVTNVYLKFEVITEIVISIPRKLTIPDITICVEDAQFVNLTKLATLYPDLSQKMIQYDREVNKNLVNNIFMVNTSVITHFILSNLRINETYFLLYPESYLIKSWEIGAKRITNDSGLEEQGCRMRGRFKDLGFCITIGCSGTTEQSFGEFDQLRSNLERPMFAVYLNHKALEGIPNLYVALVKNSSLPRGNKIKFITLNMEKQPRKYPISYHIFRSNLLPSPYSTFCEDYSTEKYDSMEHARELCLTNLTLERFNVPFPKVLAPPNWGYYFGYKLTEMARNNSSLQNELDAIILNCITGTNKPHCHDTFYITTATNSEIIASRDSYIDLRMPVEPYIDTTCQPKQSLPEYLIYAGSVLGTWFGFNFAFSVPLMIDYCDNLLFTKDSRSNGGVQAKVKPIVSHQSTKPDLSSTVINLKPAYGQTRGGHPVNSPYSLLPVNHPTYLLGHSNQPINPKPLFNNNLWSNYHDYYTQRKYLTRFHY